MAPPPLEDTGAKLYPLLARANLLRMRGRWQEAAHLCGQVLEMDPQNATAHSLMGDVYENHGNLNEALRWYDMALALNPCSEADAAKKARVQELLEARQRRAEWQAALQARQPAVSARALVREAILRVTTIVLSAVCAIVLVTAVLVRASGPSPEPPSNAPAVPMRPPKPSPLPMASSPEERAIWRALSQRGQTAGTHGQLAGLHVDPRSDACTLRFLLPPADLRLSTLPAIQEAVMRDGYWMAFAVYEKRHALRSIDVQAFGELPASPGAADQEPVFFGTLHPQFLVVDPNVRAPNGGDLAHFFGEGTWWHPTLQGESWSHRGDGEATEKQGQ